MTRKELIEYTRKQLRYFDELERKNCDDVQWIQLKLSCSALKASRLVLAARALDAK
jgi:hypothetical protein